MRVLSGLEQSAAVGVGLHINTRTQMLYCLLVEFAGIRFGFALNS
jgi:hypothetical protein